MDKTCILLMALLLLAACGADERDEEGPAIELTADDTTLAAGGETMLHVVLTDGVEEEVIFATDLGGVGIIPAPSSEWTSSVGRVDAPFSCEDEQGTANVTATWVEEDLTASLEIVCGP